MQTPWDPTTRYSIVASKTSIGADGYALGEPKWLVCDDCGARVLLTEEPSPGIDRLDHGENCDQERAHSRHYRQMHGVAGD